MTNAVISEDVDPDLVIHRRFGDRYRLTYLPYVFVYVILAVLIFAPVSPWSGTSIPTGVFSGGAGVGDPTLMTWFLAWTAFALTHAHNLFFTNFIFSSQGTALFPYTSIPLLGTLASPVTLHWGPVAALNLLIRLAVAGSAISMFLVLSSWCRRPYAFMGGLVFGFSPYLLMQSEIHLNLAFLVLLPPIVWSVAELLVLRRRSPVVLGLTLGVLTSLQIYVSLEMTAMIVVVLGAGSLAYVAINHAQVRAWLTYWMKGVVAATGIFTVLAGYFVYNFLFGPGHLHGPIVPTAFLQRFYADLLGSLIPTANQLVTTPRLSQLSARFVAGNVTENGAYLGLPLLATLVYFALRFRTHRRIVFPFALTMFALVLSMGDRLTIAGHPLPILLPEKLLSFVPWLNDVVPARFGALVALFAGVSLALGAETFMEARRSRGPTLSAPGGVVAAVGLTMVLALTPVFPVTTATLTTPPALRAQLSVIPVGAEVLTYPFPVWNWTAPMVWQAEDRMRFRLLGGYIRPTNPPFLEPASIQKFFIAAAGVGILSFLPKTPLASEVAALRHYLRRAHVGAVIFWDSGVNPSAVGQVLTATLGSPTRRAGNKFELWVLARPSV